MTAFDQDGMVLWAIRGSFNPIVIDHKNDIYTSKDDTVYSFTSAGILSWKTKVPADITSPLLLTNENHVYFGCDDQKIYALSVDSKSIVWIYDLDGIVERSPTMSSDGDLYILSQSGTLYAFSTNSSGIDEQTWPKICHDAHNSGTLNTDTLNTEKNSSENVADNFELFQNYPNPFNVSTTISYVLYAETPLEINVIDELGRVVTTLINGRKRAGYYMHTWNAGSSPSGIYYVQVKTPHSSRMIKCIFLK